MILYYQFHSNTDKVNIMIPITAHDIQMLLCNYIKKVRKENKVTAETLANRTGISVNTIRKFEQNGQLSLRNFIIIYTFLAGDQKLLNLSESDIPSTPTTIHEVNKID